MLAAASNIPTPHASIRAWPRMDPLIAAAVARGAKR